MAALLLLYLSVSAFQPIMWHLKVFLRHFSEGGCSDLILAFFEINLYNQHRLSISSIQPKQGIMADDMSER